MGEKGAGNIGAMCSRGAQWAHVGVLSAPLDSPRPALLNYSALP